ncbi:MAG: glycosyltransferase N-terminal domain-containing protein, partial [Paracoccaceae bacterium]
MRIYRMIMVFALPLLMAHVLWQRWRGRVPGGALRERLGLSGGFVGSGAAGPVLWLHGASNGELTSARWLIARLLAQTPGLRVVVSCNSGTARAMVQGWGMVQVQVVLAPFDTKGAVVRFLARWRPAVLIVVENELWPERMISVGAQIPVILIGARMSAGTARNWTRFAPELMRAMLGAIAWVSPQDAGSEARFLALGLPSDRVLPRVMLKSRAAMAAAAPPLALGVARDRCVLAASTHEGEDAGILAGFAAARAAGAYDLLILAPRHPRRGPAIAGLIAAQGLAFVTRSAGEVPGAGTAVYLADTLGEMPLWYDMAGVCVIGGTFEDHGGHTPFEPVAHGAAVIHGRHVANFTESFGALDAGGAAVALADLGGLG